MTETKIIRQQSAGSGSSDDSLSTRATKAVDMALNHAIRNLLKLGEEEKSELSKWIYIEEDYMIPNIDWDRIENFSVKLGDELLDEFVQTWEFESCWLYCIDYLGCEEFDYDIRHRYRVRWSIPTRRKPIPRATACVYFTISLSKIKPKDYPMDVYYTFETQRLVHKPGLSRFREHWLKNIIEGKIAAISPVSF